MLEIRDVTKIYRSKTGEEVRALDGVSIRFPESGMVFLLGKSGSGKSTLLNVMGGLDSYDGGEFIIKGKSSRDFVGSDFDAYRNTFIGFIFQEYNVLDDFTVGANIGLALELQGKKATNEAIAEILSKVDLTGYAHRKPNELSGGQKQRVAIARALVKDPQIIMADEPTGALDSNTGKQIFDALKELSRDKLVIIVSHDRDFAEKYADRIIELSDGKIIEDVTKHSHEAEQLSEGVKRINKNILRIERGYRLTARDLEMINEYLAQNEADVLMSNDSRVNDELCTSVGISKEGASTVFEHTDQAADIKLKEYTKKDSKFIRSRLPMKNAVKMGSSGLKHKKFRLFMTILLSFISFAMFGLSSTVAAYEQISSATLSILDSNVRNASITANVRHTTYYTDRDDVYHYYQKSTINEEDIAYLNANTGLNFVPVYTGNIHGKGGFSVTNQMETQPDCQAYTGAISGFVNISYEEFQKTGYTLTGEWADEENEIVITEHLYRQFKEYGFKNLMIEPMEEVAKGDLLLDDSENGIIGKHISFQGQDFIFGSIQYRNLKIVGVVNTNFDYARYEAFMPKDPNAAPNAEDTGLMDMVLGSEMEYELDYGFHALAFTTKDTITAIANSSSYNYIEIGTYMSSWNNEMHMVLTKADESAEGDGKGGFYFSSGSEFWRVARMSDLENLGAVEWLDGRTNNVLGEKEVLISASHKDMFKVNQASITVTDEMLADLVAMVGEESWNEADPSNESVNFYDRLRRRRQANICVMHLPK